jgi:DnaJ-class molecular chaperone
MNPDDKKAKERFQAVQKAYEVLSDPQKRELYDRYGSSFESAAGGPQGAWQGAGPGGVRVEDIDLGQIFGERFGGAGDAGGGFAEMFRQFTRGGRRAGSATRGADVAYELRVPFQTSIQGGEAQVVVHRGTGRPETIAVKIPSGIEDGKKIRLRGQGESGPRGGAAGDLLITVRVAPHPCFQRRGNHLELSVPITLGEAIEGAAIDVPTPKGTISLKVPPGTSSGKKLRIRGHGIVAKDGTAGDLLVELQIVLPSLDELPKEMSRKVQEWKLGPRDPRRHLSW